MPPIIQPLNEANAYIYCPTCRDQNTPNTMLQRAGTDGAFTCMFGHRFVNWANLQQFNPRMVPMSDFFHEQPNPEAMKYSFFVMPKTMDRLRAKFPQNLMATVATLLDALSDESVLILQGSEIAELRKKGMQIKNGVEIIRALEGVKQMELERDEAVKKLDELMGMLRREGLA